MAGASGYLATLTIVGFLFLAWLATKVSRLVGVSSIVLEIATGVVLGPSVLGLVAPEYSECPAARHMDCKAPPNFAELVRTGGHLGEGLGMIANMDVCPRGAHLLEHTAEDMSEEVELDDAGIADEAPQHGGVNASTASNASADEEEEDGASNGGASNASADEEGDEGAANVTQHADHHRRRLDSGGYASYEECLVKSCEAEVARQCKLTPGFFTLIGYAGVSLMIFESGMHFDLTCAAKVGTRAGAVALLSTSLPVIAGAVLMILYGRPFMPDGISAGVALAPTSVGIALRLLSQANVLQEEFGQAIITAAFLDDILSLLLLTLLFNLTGEANALAMVGKPILAVLFVGVGMAAAAKFWPGFINKTVLPKISNTPGSKGSRKDEALFLIMMILFVGYGTITHFLGTHLLGCFIAGMSFSSLSQDYHAHHVWVKQTKRITAWLIRIFFAATFAFSVPVGELLSLNAFWKGTVLGLIACVAAKVCCAPFMGEAKWVVGWAMAERAEFAYLIAHMAAAGDMMNEETFSIVIWALLYATIFPPLIFRRVMDSHIARYVVRQEEDQACK